MEGQTRSRDKEEDSIDSGTAPLLRARPRTGTCPRLARTQTPSPLLQHARGRAPVSSSCLITQPAKERMKMMISEIRSTLYSSPFTTRMESRKRPREGDPVFEAAPLKKRRVDDVDDVDGGDLEPCKKISRKTGTREPGKKVSFLLSSFLSSVSVDHLRSLSLPL